MKVYTECRNCKNRCKCCSSHFHDHYPNCQSCEQHFDEFKPAKHIIYCPLTGKKVEG